MAQSGALVAVALTLAWLCVASAGRIPAEPSRKLIAAEDLSGVIRQVVIVFDLRQIKKTVTPGRVTLLESVVEGVEDVVVQLVPGQVAELKAVQVQLQAPGIVHLLLEILGLRKVIALDLAHLKPTLVGGAVRAVVVLVLDEVKQILHFRDYGGNCASLPFNNLDFQVRVDELNGN